MTTNGNVQRQGLKKVGAALVIAAGAVLTALSVAAVVGIIDTSDSGFGWPVYVLTGLASLALTWTGIQNWRRIV